MTEYKKQEQAGVMDRAFDAFERRMDGEVDAQASMENRTAWTNALVDKLQSSEQFMKSFSEPEARLEFLSGDNFKRYVLSLMVTVNAGLRGMNRKDLVADMKSGKERGAELSMLHTPASPREKSGYMVAGIEAIREYINTSDEAVNEKVEAVSMAYEALIVWTHMFNDANGRTSRFMAQLIKDGPSDGEKLTSETVSKAGRPIYNHTIQTREALLEMRGDSDILSDETDEGVDPDDYPSDIEAVVLEMKYILQDSDYREGLKEKVIERKRRLADLAIEATSL